MSTAKPHTYATAEDKNTEPTPQYLDQPRKLTSISAHYVQTISVNMTIAEMEVIISLLAEIQTEVLSTNEIAIIREFRQAIADLK